MSAECLLCRLVCGDLPSYRVYEDDRAVVLLTIHPINPGHVLVVPREHIGSFYDMEDDVYVTLMLLVKRMAQAIDAIFAPQQVVMETSGVSNRHVHVHVLPVYGLYDRVPREVIERLEAYSPPDEELAEVARCLADCIAN